MNLLRRPGIRRLLSLLMVLALFVGLMRNASGAVVLGSSTGTQGSSVSSLTWSHAVAAGSNRVLLVRVANINTNVTVSGVTYGGTALTSLATATSGSGTSALRASMWYLAAPAVGTANVIVTLSGSTRVQGYSTNATGVSQSTPFGTTATTSGSSTTPSVTVAAATGDLVIDMVAALGTIGSATAGSGQSAITGSTGSTASDVFGMGSTKAGAASVTMSWTMGATSPWVSLGVAFKQATTYAVSGTVFEDVNYGGGAGRSLASSGGVGVAGATVELYNSAGSYVSTTTSAAGGGYSFGGLAAGTYYVRVVGGSVPSQRSGNTASLGGVLTYRTDASSGSASAVTDQVGGTNPALVDPGAASSGAAFSTSTYVYGAGLSGTAQAVAPITVSGSDIGSVDFGFNFDTVVNTNDSGAGSLRQAITNANTLGGDTTLAQSGRSAGIENLVFMISNGTAGSGLRSAYNYFTTSAGSYNVATIAPAGLLPTLTNALVLDAQTQPGWTLAPLIELNGTSAGATTTSSGLQPLADNCVIRGFVINRFAGEGIYSNSGNNFTIQGNYLGTNAAGTAASANARSGLYISGSSSGHLIGGTTVALRNVVSGNTRDGLALSQTTNSLVQGNYIGVNASGGGTLGNGRYGINMGVASGYAIGGTAAGAGNIVANNTLGGVMVTTGATGVSIQGNSIYGNSGLGIDLDGDGLTANDGAKTTGQANLDMDYPVFTTASLDTTTLTVAGYVGSTANQSAFASARVELFASDATNVNGQGKTYLGYLAADASGNFSGTIGGVSGLTAGSSKITGTATDASGNTSEFGPNLTVSLAITGTVFEDVNYGGGSGRSLSASGGAGLSGATVELYNSSGTWVSNTTTGSDGSYSLTGLASGTYYVRVVNSTVASQRSGTTSALRGVMTYRTDASSGTASAVSNYVGGTNPALVDPGTASSGAKFTTSTGVYSAGLSGTAQSFSPVVMAAGNSVSGVDFGFNFDSVVNTNDTGQGSLRQAITNANALGGDASLAQSGRIGGIENLVFMISNGSAGSGLRNTYNYFTTSAGSYNVATLVPGSGFPALSSPLVIDAQTQPGWTLAPLIEVNAGNQNIAVFTLSAGSSSLRGFVINRVNTNGAATAVRIDTLGGNTVQGNYLGLDAAGSTATTNGGQLLNLYSGGNQIGGTTAAARNVIGKAFSNGIAVWSGSANVIQGNYIGTNAAGTAALGSNDSGIVFPSSSTATGTVIGGVNAGEGNLISGNLGTAATTGGISIQGTGATGTLIRGNSMGLNATGSGTIASGGYGVYAVAAGTTIGGTATGAGNVITASASKGVAVVGSSATGVAIEGNSIYGNGGIGIDLANDGLSSNDGAKSANQPNLLMDYPVFTTASLSGSTLTVAGYVGSAAGQSTFASARVEVFISDVSNPNGQGKTYLGYVTADASGNFSGTISGVAGLTAGTSKVTGTATDTSNNSSEFGPNVLTGYTIAGNVFEDVNYGGGSGRSLATSGGAGVSGATVELYNSSGTWVSATTSASGGSYSFTGLAAGSYFVRVVNSSVLSTRSGSASSLVGVMTYRSTAASGSAVAVTDNVGGTNPAVVDPGAGSSGATFNTTTFVFSAVLSGTAQSVAPVTIGSSGAANLDFGFNFDTIVNTNDSGAGSLRQAMSNANALGGDSSLAQSGRTGSIENLVFMISNGTTGSGGLRSTNNYFSGGIATIAPVSALPTISTPMVIDAQTQPGWSSAPIVDLNGAGAGSATGLGINGYVGSTGSTLRGFVIRNFSGNGVQLLSGSGHTVAGNYIGISAAGTTAAANTSQGINIFQSAGNTIGGTATSARNVISGNSANGIVVSGSGATGNVIAGNYVGTNALGTAAIKNGAVGIDLSASTNTVGGTAAGAGNLISGNTYSGIQIDSGATGNTVQGNTIGLSSAGSALANGNHGVYLVGTSNTIGGSVSGAGNVISGNVFRGVRVDGASNTIAGNIIGLNAGGTAKVGNTDGIYVNGAANTTIGGTSTLAANTIAGNSNDGVVITGSGATGTLVRGNWIGSTSSGTAALGNGGNGVSISSGASSNTIGGTAASNANTIRNNTGRGVSVTGASTGNAIEGNSIYGNTQIGIDLGADGITANDGAKTTSQPNLLMDSPVFTSATISGTTLTVAGYIGSAPSQSTFASSRVEVFASDASSTNGSGQTYLGFVTADSSGNFSGAISGVAISAGSQITGTATDTSGNSSEFGVNFTAGATIVGSVFEDVNYGGGAGRSLATSGGSGLAGATVELYNSSGSYVSNTTTASGGSYSFNGLSVGTYYVRVVGGTVASQRSGTTASLAGVPTYLTDASSGSAVAVTDRVGGTNPALTDPGTASSGAALNTSTGVFSAGLSGTAQAFSPIALPSTGVAGVDFGFNFDTVVNTNDSGPGSLRQAITNANALGGDSSLAQSGRTAGIENLVFMVSNGTAGSGLRSAYNYFSTSAGSYNVATIAPLSAPPQIGAALVIDAQTQPGWALAPLIEINGAGIPTAGGTSRGFNVGAANVTVRGFIVNRVWADAIYSNSNNTTVQGNYIGTNAAGSATSLNNSAGIYLSGSTTGHQIGGTTAAQRNVISGNKREGISLGIGGNSQIQGNYIGVNAANTAVLGNGSAGSFNGISVGSGASATVAIGGSAAGSGNVIAGSSGNGIAVGSGATGVAILGNSVYANTSLGIDLDSDGITANDGGKTAGRGNLDMDYPVFTSVSLSGTTLSVAGYVGSAASQSTFASARVEIFISDASNANGQGKTYLGYLTTDASGNFSGTISGVSGVTAGSTAVTGTATDTANNTSEFGPNATVASLSLAGTVFEDSNYGGGAGRSLAGSGGSGVSGATVELYSSTGSYVSSTTTASGGSYSFSGVQANTSYFVRVVGPTVASTRSGSITSLVGVMSYRTTASSGGAVAVTDNVGGTNPALVDPGAASSGAAFSTSTFVYSAGLSGTAQAVAPVTLATASIGGLDFGFNFDTIVNTNDSGAGSLRQAITNANTLTGDSSLAQNGRTGGIENLVFMIPNGTSAAGLRSAYNYFTTSAGSYFVATMAPASALPSVSAALVIDAQTQPGWTQNPIIELNGTSGGSSAGLTLSVAGNVVRGLVINRWTGDGINLVAGSNTVAGNWIGLNAAGTAASVNTGHGIEVGGAGNTLGGGTAAARNVVSGNGGNGIYVRAGANNIIQGNYVGTNAAGTAAVGNSGTGIYTHASTSGNTIGGASTGLGNVVSGNAQSGIILRSGGGSNIIRGNIIGLNATASAALANTVDGIRLSSTGNNNSIGGTGTGDGNTIASNTGNGITIFGSPAAAGNPILGNSIYANGALGIDLGTTSSSGGDGITVNTGAKTSGQPNLLMNYPVFTSVSLSGTTLTVAGYVGSAAGQSTFASSRVEVFVSDGTNVNGQGKTYLGYLTADASGNFSGTISGVAGVTAGSSKITGTATDTSNNTSEFGPNLTAGYVIGGTVFEDANYGGGAGRSLAGSGGSGVAGATVELYNSGGSYVSSTTTASGGGYSFTSLAAGTYSVRVVGSTVASQRSGSSSALRGVMTWRTDASSGTPAAVTDHVGGTNPALVDPGAASSGATLNRTTGVYSAGLSGTAQSLAPVILSTAGVAGVDFGFNFDSVVNTNDSGAGSLRQAITNANALGGDSSLAQNGRTAAVENLVFMISNGTAGSGLRSTYNYFTTVAGSGFAATIAPTSALPTVSGSVVIDAQTQPGWSLNPIVELSGVSAGSTPGLTLSGAGSALRGLVINRFTGDGLALGAASNTVAGNWIGVTAAGTAAAANTGHGINITAGGSNTIGGASAAARNVISGNANQGIEIGTGNNNVIQGNYLGTNAAGTAAVANGVSGIYVHSSTSGNTIGGSTAGLGNLISGNAQSGITLRGGNGSNVIKGNIIGLNAAGSSAIANGAGITLSITGSNNTIGGTGASDGNTIAGNTGNGIVAFGNATNGNAFLGNSIYANGGIGIDLGTAAGSAGDGATANDGAKTTGQPNLWMDTPVFTSAALSGSTLGLTGYVGSAANQSVFAGARVEVFISDAAFTNGSGKTYLGYLTADSNGNFSGTLSGVSGITVGSSKITGTATDTSNNSSEFGPNLTVSNLAISGTVFEDVNYGGGAGRNLASSGGPGVSGATVELYNSSGAYVSSTTTASGGGYSFVGVSPGTYAVRVVNSKVASQRSGSVSALVGVMTYRSDASSGTAVDVSNLVGGTNPALVDPGAASSGAALDPSSGVFSSGLSGTAQALAPVAITAASVTSVDFGFNFDTVVNTNNTGQGSLRQAITNANTLTGDASLAQSGRTAAIENLVFMISNGSSAAGLRSGNNYFSGGVATITPASALPTVSSPLVLDAQTQPGWTLAPVIELNGSSAGSAVNGLTLGAAGSVLRGWVINRFKGDGLRGSSASSLVIQGNYIGTTATGNAAAPNVQRGIYLQGGGSNHTVGGTLASQRNVVSGNSGRGITIAGGSGHLVQGNLIGVGADGSTVLANNGFGLLMQSGASNSTVGGTAAGAANLIRGNTRGVQVDAGVSGIAILGNSIYGNNGLGINLGAPGPNLNDGAKTTGQANLLMDTPVFTSATVSGTTLTVAGYVGSAAGQSLFANARVEVFISDVAASGYGEGQTWLGYLTTDASGNFSGTISGVSGVSNGSTKITGTATDGSGNTSEFGPDLTVGYAIGGTVFEDLNYGGGAGRSLAASSGAGVGGATVELYSGAGVFIRSTTTASGGSYTFSGLGSASYFVRVADGTVASTRSGSTAGLSGVMTWRSDTSSGTAVAVTDNVGGTNPALADPGTASSGAAFDTSTFVYGAGLSGTAQSVAPVTVGSGAITGIDFGFNFDTVVNTNDTGQGSLRQAITNANTLGDDASLAQSGRTAAIENIVFMLSNGTAGAGLRSAYNLFGTPAGSYSVATITPASALPAVSAALVIDAQTQPGWSANPLIELRGSSAGATDGLSLGAAGTTVRGLVINRWTGNGIHVTSGGGDTIQGCWIGVDASGSSAAANTQSGISIGSSGNAQQIGGTTAAQRNVISGNGVNGVDITAGGGHVISGNYIGTNATGTAAVGNAAIGVYLRNNLVSATVGGTAAGAGNVVSGNQNGIRLDSGTITVQGNLVGLNAAGTAAVANTQSGIYATSGGHVVGGTASGAGNVIAGNSGNGVQVGAGSAGNAILGNSIYGNGGIGIDLGADGITANDGAETNGAANLLMDSPVFGSARARGNQLTVAGYIGTAAGQSLFAGSRVEVFLSDSTSPNGSGKTWLGALTADASGNFNGTITLAASVIPAGSVLTATATDSAGNTSEFGANFAALVVDLVVNSNADGNDASPGDGICQTATANECTLRAALTELNALAAQSSPPTIVFAIPGCTSGAADTTGTPAGLQLTVSGSSARGLRFSGWNTASAAALLIPNADNAVVEANWFGLDASGSATTASANRIGIVLRYANGARIGGATSAQRNVISNSTASGIYLYGGSGASVLGNYVGTDASGNAAAGNAIGIANDAAATVIGGTGSGAGNLFAGNTTAHVAIDTNGGAVANASATVQGNRFGLAAGGAVISSANDAVWVGAGVANSVIGGTAAGAGNVITGSLGQGIGVVAGAGTQVTIEGNAIYGNALLGIDLGRDGVSANDGAYNTAAANSGIDFPVITAAGYDPATGALTVTGYVGTGTGQAAFANARVEFFSSDGDASGYGEGAAFLGTLTTDASGHFNGSMTVPAGVSFGVGSLLTGTATDAAGNSSEFGPDYTTTTVGAMSPSRFNAFETSTASGALVGVLQTRVAGTAGSVAVIALDATGAALQTGFTGTVTLSWMQASDNSGTLDAGNCRSTWVVTGGAGSAGSMSFAAGDAGRHSGTVTPTTVGREWRLRISYTAPGGTTTMSCSTDAFAVRPASLAITAISDTDDATAGTVRLLDNLADSGGRVHRAGRPFSLRAAAQDAGGVLATGYDGTPALAVTGCVLPASGCIAGTLSAPTLVASGGAIAADTLSYSEVGAIDVQLTDDNFAAIDAADTPLAQRRIQSSVVGVGRFEPDHYLLAAANTPQFKTQQGSCAQAGQGFTFVGQSFGWTTAPAFTVTAQNAAGATTLMWAGSLQRLTPANGIATPSIAASSAQGLTPTATWGTMTLSDAGNGVARVVMAGDQFLFSRDVSTPVASFDPLITIGVAVSDTSELGTSGNHAVTSSSALAIGSGTGIAFDLGSTFDYARLKLQNAFGDVRYGVSANVELQKYTSRGWLRLAEDNNCVTVPQTAVAFSNGTGAFADNVCSAPAAAGVALRQGRGTLVLPKTPASAQGASQLTLNIDSTLEGSACASGVPVAPISAGWQHLRTARGTSSTQDQNPAARLVWGRQHRDFIAQRELF